MKQARCVEQLRLRSKNAINLDHIKGRSWHRRLRHGRSAFNPGAPGNGIEQCRLANIPRTHCPHIATRPSELANVVEQVAHAPPARRADEVHPGEAQVAAGAGARAGVRPRVDVVGGQGRRGEQVELGDHEQRAREVRRRAVLPVGHVGLPRGRDEARHGAREGAVEVRRVGEEQHERPGARGRREARPHGGDEVEVREQRLGLGPLDDAVVAQRVAARAHDHLVLLLPLLLHLHPHPHRRRRRRRRRRRLALPEVAGLQGGRDAGVVGGDGGEARAVVGGIGGREGEDARKGRVRGLHRDAASRAEAIRADGRWIGAHLRRSQRLLWRRLRRRRFGREVAAEEGEEGFRGLGEDGAVRWGRRRRRMGGRGNWPEDSLEGGVEAPGAGEHLAAPPLRDRRSGARHERTRTSCSTKGRARDRADN